MSHQPKRGFRLLRMHRCLGLKRLKSQSWRPHTVNNGPVGPLFPGFNSSHMAAKCTPSAGSEPCVCWHHVNVSHDGNGKTPPAVPEF